jgi:hypothetical protein
VSTHHLYRRLAQAAEWALLAIVVLLHVAGWLCYHPLAAAGPIGQLLADSLPLATLLLLACWCGLGPGEAWVRGCFAAVFLVISFVVTGSTWGATYSWTHNDTLLGLAPLATFAFAIGLRLSGYSVPTDPAAGRQIRGATFTIRSLLVITTVIALGIGALESARPLLHARTADAGELALVISDRSGMLVSVAPSTPWNVVEARILDAQRKGQFRLALAAALVASAALLAFAAILCPGAIWLRLAGQAALIPAAGWYVGHLTATSSESTFTLTLWVATTTAIVAGSLVPLRLMGFRLSRRRAVQNAQPSTLCALPRFTSDRDHLVTRPSIRPSAEVQP